MKGSYQEISPSCIPTKPWNFWFQLGAPEEKFRHRLKFIEVKRVGPTKFTTIDEDWSAVSVLAGGWICQARS